MKQDDKNNQHFKTDHLEADLKGRSIRGGVVTGVAQAIKFGLTLVSNVVLARLLVPEDYGLVGMVSVITSFIALFKDIGLSMATVQKAEINHEQVSTLFWINVLLSGAIALLTAALAPLIAWFYGDTRLIKIALALAGGFIFSGFAAQHQALLNRQMQFRTLVGIDLIASGLGVATGITLALHGFSYWSLVLMQLVIPLTHTIGAWMTCSWRPGLPSWKSGIGSMLAFGGNLTGFNTINYLARNLDNLLIGWRWGAQPLGLYNKAYQLLLLPLNQINSPIASVAIPTLSRIVDTPERYRKAYLRILEKLIMITAPLMVFMMATSDWLIQILLGDQWSDASQIFIWLSLAGLIQPIANSTGWLFISQGRTRHMFQWGIISGTITIISFWIGLPWGAIGVSASYSLFWLGAVMPLLFWFVGRTGPVKTKDFYQTSVPFLFASLGTALGLVLFRQRVEISSPWIGCVLALLIAVGINLLILTLLPAGRAALKDFKGMAPIIFRKKSDPAT